MSAKLLVFTRTGAYRHDSIPAGIDAVCSFDGFTVTATEDPDVFTGAALARFAAVVFLSTSGVVLPELRQRLSLEAYVRGGGGFAGIHGAIATEPDWPWYGSLIGIRFDGHPDVQSAVTTVTDPAHPATAHLAQTWLRTDEWYNYAGRLQPGCRVLLTVDESTYAGGTYGAGHPVAWHHENCGGPVFVTALGHLAEAYGDPEFRDHLRGGISSIVPRASR